jgi:Zn-finger nucleic acid-binding protein
VSLMPLEAILCPQCGAPLPEQAARGPMTCPFCATAVRPAAPRVVERVIERVFVQPAAEPLQGPPCTCPRCRSPLFPARAGDVVLHGCGSCGGIWLDNDGSRAVLARADPHVLDMVTRASTNASAAPDRRPMDLPCAQCGDGMQRVRAPRGQVELDACARHGTWFDKDELAIVSRGAELARYQLSARNPDFELSAAMIPSAGANDLEARAVTGGLAAA